MQDEVRQSNLIIDVIVLSTVLLEAIQTDTEFRFETTGYLNFRRFLLTIMKLSGDSWRFFHSDDKE